MKLTFRLLAPWFCCALGYAQEPVIRTEVRLINLTIAAMDAVSGRPVTDLNREDFEILEDGVPQKIEFFSPSADAALNLGQVMDVSGSQEKFLKRHREDIRAFLRTTLREQDRTMITGFANSVRLVHEFSSKNDAITESVEQFSNHPSRFPVLGPLVKREMGSAVYDAVFHTIQEKLAPADGSRKAVLLFSDGEDNASAHHMLDVLEAAQHSGVVIFGIHYLDTRPTEAARNLYGRSVMARLARDTGGEYFEATGDLKTAFARIGEQLRSSYQAAYRSSNKERPGSFRNISVSVHRTGIRVRHRNGYFVQ